MSSILQQSMRTPRQLVRAVRFASVFVVTAIVTTAVAAQSETTLPRTVSFNQHIRPLLSNNCYQCHGPDETHREADLRLDEQEGVEAIFIGGDLDGSDGWERIISDEPGFQMPPEEAHKELTADEIDLIRQWILQGASWEGHWSFVPIRRPELPTGDEQQWANNPIDLFVLDRMHAAHLSPSDEAERARLIRRLSFDLTGSPPTLEEIDAFVADTRPDAYERLVDRLLSSSRYGERMALMWMDAARYGDSSVFHADGPRDMWTWRNWVIDAFNHNMPYDQFTIEQLAGDLLPEPTWQQLTASGFNRNHGTTDEGGAIDEEYRVEYIVDRIKTTATVWLGLTMECAQCHDHKYDPISQKDYYRFFAFFNQSTDRGMQTRNGNAQPLIDVPNLIVGPRRVQLEQQLAAQMLAIEDYETNCEPMFQEWLVEASSQLDDIPGIPAGVVSHWSFDTGEGDQIIATAEESTEGKLHGNVQRDDGKFAKGLRFNGENFADAGNHGDFEQDQSFSFGGWIRYDANSNGAPIARMDPGNNFRGWDIHMTNGRVEFHLIHHWPDNAIKVSTKKSIPADAWHHVLVAYDGTSQADGVKIYIDGQLEEWDIQQNGLAGTTRTEKPLYFGRRNSGSVFKGAVDDVRIFDRALSDEEALAVFQHTPLGELLSLDANDRTDEQTAFLLHHYLNEVDEDYQQLSSRHDELQTKVDELKRPLSTVMVMRDRAEPRMTYVLNRGQYDSPLEDDPVEASIPTSLGTLPDGAPVNRLGMAQWLVAEDNPLTARVTVNRIWHLFFGRGIVSSSEDFGAQGTMPTHPELLDWLADDLIANGWDVKRTIKLIVTSSTYRQTSRISPDRLQADPQNVWYSRGANFRLQGEFIRDQALTVSELLVDRMGGPSVKPYQPPGLWNEVSLSGNVRFVQDHGSGLYRRSMYTYWKRSAPAPALILFDAPTREKCVVQRPITNTPMQALVTLNDTQFVEAARMLAERMLKDGGETLDQQVVFGYRLLTGVEPSERTQQNLREAFEIERSFFRDRQEDATALLTVGEFPRDESLQVSEHAAMTIVASILLNLDETLTRN